jgi:hypothetical protein
MTASGWKRAVFVSSVHALGCQDAILTNRLNPAFAAALLALALAPALMVRLPGMLDYPNHLARIAILARDATQAANPYYRAAWSFLPNIALDAFAVPLAWLVGAEAAVKTFLVLAQALTISGAVALEAAVKGRARLAPFAAPAFLFNAAFALGFLNFEFGVGLALWALAGWIALGRAPWAGKLAFAVAAESLLYASHLFALGLFGYVAGLLVASRVLRREVSWGAALLDLAVLAAPFVALELFLDPGGQSHAIAWSFSGKLTALFLCFNGANTWLAEIDALIVAALLVWLGVNRRIAFASDGLVVTIGLAALYLALPSVWRGGALVDLRALVGAMLILPAFLVLDPPAPKRAALLAIAFAAINIGAAAVAWIALAPDQTAILASFDKLGARAKVLTAYTSEGALPHPLRHVPTLAAGFGDAFVADLFAYRGQQPIAAAPDVADLVTPEQLDMPTLNGLRLALHDGDSARTYVRDWPKRFDYLYVVGPRAPNPEPSLLTPLASGQAFDLYRIEKPAP